MTDSVEFFGVKLKVRDPRLAALLNSDVTDDVVVIGRRARDLMADDERDISRADDALGVSRTAVAGPRAAHPSDGAAHPSDGAAHPSDGAGLSRGA